MLAGFLLRLWGQNLLPYPFQLLMIIYISLLVALSFIFKSHHSSLCLHHQSHHVLSVVKSPSAFLLWTLVVTYRALLDNPGYSPYPLKILHLMSLQNPFGHVR